MRRVSGELSELPLKELGCHSERSELGDLSGPEVRRMSSIKNERSEFLAL